MIEFIIAFDNGTTGTFTVMDLTGNVSRFNRVPIKKGQDMIDSKSFVTRIDVDKVCDLFCDIARKSRVFLERPFKNTMNFNTSFNAARAFEALLIAMEDLGASIHWPAVAPETWQKAMFPKGYKPARPSKKEIEKKALDLWMNVSHFGSTSVLPDKKKDPEWKSAILEARKLLAGPKVDTKALSRDIGAQLWPYLSEQIVKFKDADSALMAEWARRTFFVGA